MSDVSTPVTTRGTNAGPLGTGSLLTRCLTCRKPAVRCECLWDIKDPSSFVYDTINASKRFYSPDELEELHAEGLAILHRLADRFIPQMEGYEQEGRFAGFAAKYLRLKLEDAYHSLHPEHVHVTREDGTREWLYHDRAVSLEAMTAEDPDRHQIMASKSERTDLHDRLYAALTARARGEITIVVGVATRMGKLQPLEVAARFGLTLEMVQRHMRTIARAADLVGAGRVHIFEKTSEVRAALNLLAERDAERIAWVGEQVGSGASVADVAAMLTRRGRETGELSDIDEVETNAVRDDLEAIRAVWHLVESGEA